MASVHAVYVEEDGQGCVECVSKLLVQLDVACLNLIRIPQESICMRV